MTGQQLVGREEEIAALLAVLDAPDELPGAAVVGGEPGIGKTTLWLAATEAAKERGYLVLSSRPAEAEAGFSFVGLADLIGAVVTDVLPQLPPPQRRALEAALALSDSDAVRAEEGVLPLAFLSTLRRLADGNALLLAMDDVQWLDAPSLALVRFALPRLEAKPVAAILTIRGDVPLWLRQTFAPEHLLVLELGGLSVGALAELLRKRIHAILSWPTLRKIWETSGGNPFFALELARALRQQGGRIEPGEELPIPVSLDELVQERVDGLGAWGLDVARVVAALADPMVELVEAAVGRRTQTGLAAAVRARVLELDGARLRFAHPLLRSAVSSRTPSAQRRSLHALLAEVVTSVEERARHLALATAEPSREIASVLEEAANAAHARGAPGAAAELSELALRLTPAEDVVDARRRVLSAADRHHAAGDSRRAIALLEHARAASPAGVAHAEVLAHLANVQADVAGPRIASDLYRDALNEVDSDDALEAHIHLRLADLVRFTADATRGLIHAEAAVRAASRTDDDALRCWALATFGVLHFAAGHGIARAEMDEALAAERSHPEWPLLERPTWAHAHQLFWSGELERAQRILEEWREALNARGYPAEGIPLWYLSLLEWRRGDWDLAALYAAELLALAAQTGRKGLLFAGFPSAVIAAHRGQIDEARAQAEQALADAEVAANRDAKSDHRWLLGFIELSVGDAGAALSHLQQSWKIRDELGLLDPGYRFELADMLEALIAVGDVEEAERLLAPWEHRARRLDRSWALAILARCRALVIAARGDLLGALAGFEQALAEHERTVDNFQYARTLLALGATLRRAKRRGDARKTLEHALGIFEQLGAPLWADKARAELARIGGRAPSRGELTESERRVAILVAEGRTNREVAAELFLSERTVESHLSHVYAKLGVRSRTELSHRLR